jgi:hypothetical protein
MRFRPISAGPVRMDRAARIGMKMLKMGGAGLIVLSYCSLCSISAYAVSESVEVAKELATPAGSIMALTNQMPLSISRIYVEPPQGSDSWLTRIADVVWYFEGFDFNSLRALLTSAGMDGDRADRLLRDWGARSVVGGMEATPSSEELLALGPGERSVIYKALAKSASNPLQQWPFVVPQGDLENWLSTSGASSDTRDLISRLVYRMNGSLCFSDPQILQEIADPGERQQFAL